jgi:hypothetical protein
VLIEKSKAVNQVYYGLGAHAIAQLGGQLIKIVVIYEMIQLNLF